MTEQKPPPHLPFEGRTVQPWRLAGAIGAIAGGVTVGFWNPRPQWLWGMGGGLAGAIVGVFCWWLWARPWPLAVRLLAVVAVIGAGGFALWLAAGYALAMDFTVRPQ